MNFGITQRVICWLLQRFLAPFMQVSPEGSPPQPPREGGGPLLSNLQPYPPFTGTPEEASLHLRSPNVAIFKRTVLTPVLPDGTVPESAEFARLTGAGKVVERVNYTVRDDFGVPGPAAKIGPPCRRCNRISFASKACGLCLEFCCPVCGTQFDLQGQSVFLCKPCARLAESERDTWPSPPTKTLDVTQPTLHKPDDNETD